MFRIKSCIRNIKSVKKYEGMGCTGFFDQEYANEYYDNVKELRAQNNWFVAFKSRCVLPQRKIECIDSYRHKFWFWNKDGFV